VICTVAALFAFAATTVVVWGAWWAVGDLFDFLEEDEP
jgi:hypothetical protein